MSSSIIFKVPPLKTVFPGHVAYLFYTVFDHVILFSKPLKFISRTIREFRPDNYSIGYDKL